MTEIRELRAGDLPAVGDLLDRVLPGWSGDRRFLAATMFDHPWADPEVGSLVATDAADAVIGFIGVQARRLRHGDRRLRGACCSHLVVDKQRNPGPAGALLMGRLLAGPQDLTWSDSANEITVRIWRTFGGDLDHVRACDWMLVVRPLGWAGSLTGSLLRRQHIDRRHAPVGALPAQMFRRAAQELPPDLAAADASPAEVVEQLPGWMPRTVLRGDYDEAHLKHLLGLVRGRLGDPVSRIVSLRGRPVGWYVYVPQRASASRVFHLSGVDRHLDLVLGELLADARRRGSRVLAGRFEPHLGKPLRERMAAIGLARQPVIHAKDPELRAQLATGSALLTRLDSEWFVA